MNRSVTTAELVSLKNSAQHSSGFVEQKFQDKPSNENY
jgi:hypothetical protein